MLSLPIWRLIILFLSSSAFFLIHYEDDRYRPFGFRYWLSLVACLWIGFVTGLSYFLTLTGASLVFYRGFEGFVSGFFILSLAMVAALTFFCWHSVGVLIRRTKYYSKKKRA